MMEKYATPRHARRRADETAGLHGARVLLVDDEAICLGYARSMLRQAGLVVDTRDNGLEAVTAAAAKQYDLIVMDVNMPILDGFDAARRIRAIEAGRKSRDVGRHAEAGELKAERPAPELQVSGFIPQPSHRIPIIAMSASLFNESWEQCRAAGMDDLLVKPFVMDELLRVLRRWVMQRTNVTMGNRDAARASVAACPRTVADEWSEGPWAELDALPGVAARSAVDRLGGDRAL
jgi:two-component system, sensor histidine kinase and response regulator